MAAAEELVESASRPMPDSHAAPRDLPAGGLARALICPWRWRARAWLDELGGEAARGASEAGGEASERGDRVHAMFEAWDFQISFGAGFEALADGVAMTPEERVLVKAWIGSPVISAALEELRGAPQVWRELPFEWRVGETRISGRMDAVLRLADGTLCVLDYKTDSTEMAAEQYRWQTAIYAAALEGAGLGKVSERRLIYLQRGEVKRLEWNQDDAAKLAIAIRKVLAQLTAPAADVPACAGCRGAAADGGGKSCPVSAASSAEQP